MKKKTLSTAFGFVLTLGLLLPLSPSLVNVGVPSATQVNVNSGCIKVTATGLKVNTCINGDLQRQNVSWNSGGG
jgi:hypothetical protein